MAIKILNTVSKFWADTILHQIYQTPVRRRSLYEGDIVESEKILNKAFLAINRLIIEMLQ